MELYATDGSVGAALGAGIGAGIYASFDEAFTHFRPLEKIEPNNVELYEKLYKEWKKLLENHLNK